MHRAERNQEIFRIELAARAKTAADVDLHHVDGRHLQPEHPRQQAAVEERHLGGAMHGEVAFAFVPVGEQAASFHRHGAMALHAEGFAAAIVGRGESGIGIALCRRERHRPVAAGIGKQQDAISGGRGHIRDHIERRDLNFNQRGGIFGDRQIVGNDDGDRLADITHDGVGDHRLQERQPLIEHLLPQRNFLNARRHIRCRDDSAHARQCPRRLGTDGHQPAMGHAAAQDRGVGGAVGFQVGDILPLAAEKAPVFGALHRTAHQRVGHAHGQPRSAGRYALRASITAWTIGR